MANLKAFKLSLLVWLFVEETDENDGHVVTAESAHGAVRGQAAHHQLLADVLGLHSLANAAEDEINDLLRKQFE